MDSIKQRALLRWAVAGLMLVGLATLPAGSEAFAKNSGPRYHKHTLHGRYIASYHGFDASNSNTPYAVSGVFFSDGAGGVHGVQNIDYGAAGTGASFQCTFTGTYDVSNTPMKGLLTLNVTQNDCKVVDCTENSGVPDCAAGAAADLTNSQWFCALSAPSGKSMVCTEMGEVPPGGGTSQAPISAVTWNRVR